MRKLATVRKIQSIFPIQGADNIEVAVVDGWNCVVRKGVFSANEIIVYIEIDSFIPLHSYFDYLRNSSYKKMGDKEGYRLKTIRLKGVYSQGLVVSIKDLMTQNLLSKGIYYLEDEVTEELGIVLYEPPLSAQLSGNAKGLFPSFIPKTDEERVQNLNYEELLKETYYVTEKLDGSSITIYLKDNEFGVCSRNLDLLEDDTNTFWKTVRSLGIENILRSKNFNNIALQGELIGEGIQGNKYGIKGHSIRFFNVFDISNNSYYSFTDFVSFIKDLGLQTVPIIDDNMTLLPDRSNLLLFAEGKSILKDSAEREGLVFRTKGKNRVSFKAISNKFLLKEKD